MEREETQFTSHGDRCAAWLYRAAGDRAPAIVMAHGLSGTRRDRLGPFAERFDGPEHEAVVTDELAFLRRVLRVA